MPLSATLADAGFYQPESRPFLAHVATVHHALYDVRRILLPRRTDPMKKAPGWLAVRTDATGTLTGTVRRRTGRELWVSLWIVWGRQTRCTRR